MVHVSLLCIIKWCGDLASLRTVIRSPRPTLNNPLSACNYIFHKGKLISPEACFTNLENSGKGKKCTVGFLGILVDSKLGLLVRFVKLIVLFCIPGLRDFAFLL